jgi:hypothetical protein
MVILVDNYISVKASWCREKGEACKNDQSNKPLFSLELDNYTLGPLVTCWWTVVQSVRSIHHGQIAGSEGLQSGVWMLIVGLVRGAR